METKEKFINRIGVEKIEIVKNMILNGKTSDEISSELKVSIKSITKIRKIFNITTKKKRQPIVENKIKEDVIKYINEGKTNTEIIQELNVGRSLICKIARDNNLKTNIKDINPEISLSYEEEQVLIGGLLGDSYIGMDGYCKYPRGSITHCIKQYDYAVYKQKYLNRLTNKTYLVNKYDKRSNRHYQQAWINIKSQKALFPYYNSFYKNGKKIIEKEMLYKIDALGLAIWFMDDGSASYTTYGSLCGFLFATMCFSDKELDLIQCFFKDKFDLNTTIHKDRCIYVTADSREKFLNLISKYIPDCMKYKISNKILNK